MSKSIANFHEILALHGITRSPVDTTDEDQLRQVKRTLKGGSAPVEIVTYTSDVVYITGFLHFGTAHDNCDTVYLCDKHSTVPSLLLDPTPIVIDQLVLVKRWILVEKVLGGVYTSNSLFLEVHDKNPVLLWPRNEMETVWTQNKVLHVLETCYKTKDPPMYTGPKSWAESLAPVRRDQLNNSVDQSTADESDLMTPKKYKKRKRVHVAFGHVTSVSPISRQNDCKSSHFFVEIECRHTGIDSTTQSTVNVMFTGVYSMRWHLFLRPGKKVLVTDLVKVFSRECEMFLLQTTHKCGPGHLLDTNKGSMKTVVLVWEDSESLQTNLTKWINDSLQNFSRVNLLRCSGKLVDYEGKVYRLLWDECIELQGHDNTRVIVSLFHFPYEQELVWLRKGSILRVYGAHVLRWPTPVGGRLVIGLCPRSHLVVAAFGDSSGSCLVKGTHPRSSRPHKKWSSLGDFHSQSAVLSIWMLELLELLNAKFFFRESKHVCSIMSFPRIRRRQAAIQVANRLGLLITCGDDQVVRTLGALFLKCHSTNANNCTALQLPFRDKMLTSKRALTISELQAFGRSQYSAKTEATSGGKTRYDEAQSIRISAECFDWCLLFACIRGNVDSGDLAVCDRTGSMPLRLRSTSTCMDYNGGQGVYLLQNFDLMVEDYSQIKETEHENKIPMVFCMSCAVSDIEFISFHEEETVVSLEEKTTTGVQVRKELVFLVTHVDALPLSSIRSAGILAEYRILHGMVCPIGEGLQAGHFIKSMCVAELLVNTAYDTWYIQKGSCYRVQALEISTDGGSRVSSQYSVEDMAVKTSMDYWDREMVAENNSILCFDSLEKYCCQIDGESIIQDRPFRMYQIEDGQMTLIRFDCKNFELERCVSHKICQQIYHGGNGVAAVPAYDNRRRWEATRMFDAQHLVKHTLIEVSVSEFMAMAVLRYFLQQSEKVAQVSSLLQHPLISRSQQLGSDGKYAEEGPTMSTVEPSLHKPHLVSIVGIVTKKKYYWQFNTQKQFSDCVVQTETVRRKRARDCHINIAGGSIRRLRCILYICDLQYLDTVEIRVDASHFGVLGTFQRGDVVELSKLQGYIARSSYKVFLSWCHVTAARLVFDKVCLLARDATLFGSMPTTFVNDLYDASKIDRMVHRYVVGVMHIGYVLLKRKCALCHQSLELNKRRGCWKHAESHDKSKYLRDCAWKWQRMAPSDPMFQARTYMGTSMRCIIDDGSGQAELYLENDVAWEMLMCTNGQRQRFANILSNYIDELSYYAGRTTNGSFATNKAEREQEYYQNELRAFVVDVIPLLRSIVVYAQQFYSGKQKESLSVLTFGKDIHITTKAAPLPKLEAKRVDKVHVRNELKRRLVQYQLSRS